MSLRERKRDKSMLRRGLCGSRPTSSVDMSVRNGACVRCLLAFTSPHVERDVVSNDATSPAQHIAACCQYGLVLRKCCMCVQSNFAEYSNLNHFIELSIRFKIPIRTTNATNNNLNPKLSHGRCSKGAAATLTVSI